MDDMGSITPGAKVRIAIDIGGTFTDLQILDEASGADFAHKTPTTPEDPSQGLIAGLDEAAARLGFDAAQVSMLIHGTTIATNAVLERKLPAGALLTTAGFEDVLEIGRHMRQDIYANKAPERTLLVPRSRRFGITERLRADGSVETALDEAGVEEVAGELRRTGVETVAVAFFHAYANPVHERRVGDILAAALPGVPVSLSADISPEIKEFERTSTTVLNALLIPVVGAYLKRLQDRLAEHGVGAPLYLVQSNGGVATPEIAASQPARLLLSGPSGGTRAAETIARRLDLANLVAVDMGGTSYDVSLVAEGGVRRITEGQVDGCPVRLPMVEIRSIGAGGGSIARVGTTGDLSVGPQSAGADPGPACYGGGGESATVTDANVVLGRIDTEGFLGGAMRLDPGAAHGAVARQVADPLGMKPEAAADGLIRITVARMASAIRLSLFEKGLDPADFTVASFGGAGGLHACHTADELGIGRVVFPRHPGTLSAWGMLHANIVHDLARARLMRADDHARPQLAAIMEDLASEGDAWLERDGVAASERRLAFSLDMRYRGQAYEIATPISGADALGEANAAFHALHRAQFAHADEAATPEIVTVRLAASGLLAKPRQRQVGAGNGTAPRRRRVHVDGVWHDVPVFERDALAAEAALVGPAMVEEAHSAILIPAGWRAALTLGGELVAERSPEDGP